MPHLMDKNQQVEQDQDFENDKNDFKNMHSLITANMIRRPNHSS